MTAFINSYTSPNSLDYKISTPILKPIRGLKAQHYILKEFLSIKISITRKLWFVHVISQQFLEFWVCFRTTYDKVLAKSEKMWQYEKFQIITDFQDRWCANLDIVFLPILKCIRKCKKRRYMSVGTYWCSILYNYIGKNIS